MTRSTRKGEFVISKILGLKQRPRVKISPRPSQCAIVATRFIRRDPSGNRSVWHTPRGSGGAIGRGVLSVVSGQGVNRYLSSRSACYRAKSGKSISIHPKMRISSRCKGGSSNEKAVDVTDDTIRKRGNLKSDAHAEFGVRFHHFRVHIAGCVG